MRYFKRFHTVILTLIEMLVNTYPDPPSAIIHKRNKNEDIYRYREKTLYYFWKTAENNTIRTCANDLTIL
ncbi:hypothetical protein J31TS3_02150 [Paenibacillus lactis]|nr:hypothetical protein J31TS3_02150 [Paenibacillus lactis]